MADQVYQTQSYRLGAGAGVFARMVYDAPASGQPYYLDFDNLESREEGATASRFGLAALTTNGTNANFPLGAAVNSLSRMQGIGTPYRYAATSAGNLFRRAGNSPGAYTQIATGLSGGRVSMSPYRPANSSSPWQFIADAGLLLKDSGTLAPITISTISYAGGFAPTATVTVASTSTIPDGSTVTIEENSNGLFNQAFVATILGPTQFTIPFALALAESGTGGGVYVGTIGVAENWGIAPPTQPALIAPVAPGLLDIELFDESTDASFTLTNLSGAAMLARVAAKVTSAVTGPGVQAVFVETLAVTSISRTSGVSTVTATSHGFVNGMRVSVTVNPASDQSFAVSSVLITVTGINTFTYPNAGPNGSLGAVATVSPMPSLEVGMSVTTTDANVETVFITEVFGMGQYQGQPGFVANFAATHSALFGIVGNYLSGTVAANTLATVSVANSFNISFPTTQVAEDQNYVQIFLLATNPLAIEQISVAFDVGDGTFTQDYYAKAVQMSPAQTVASGTVTAASAQTSAVAGRAAGLLNVSTLAGNNPSLLPSDYPILQQLQPAVLDPGTSSWTLIQIPLSEFVANGAAGGPNNGWANVVAWEIQIQTAATLSTSIGLDDMVFVGGSDLNSFAGQPYDYKTTYVNLNTGCESNPSQTMVASDQSTFNSFSALVATVTSISSTGGVATATCVSVPSGVNVGDTIQVQGNSNTPYNRDWVVASVNLVTNKITWNFPARLPQTGTGGAIYDLSETVPLSAFLPIPLAVQQQGIEVRVQPSPDPQVTHWNLYRRGGSLTQAWYFVAQIPIGTLAYIDVLADSLIEINNQLQVDSDAPVTSLLPTPLDSTVSVTAGGSLVNMGPGPTTVQLASGTVYPNQVVTIDTGALQETCYVQSVAGSNVTLYLQFLHGTSPTPSMPFSTQITATQRTNTPMNLSAIAFDQAFLAGDPNNPHVLYYSQTYAPETFPQENSLEVGTPDAPIMALVVLRGFLYVFTTKTVWQIFGGQGAPPVAVPTGVMHGMAASWAWAAAENIVYYLSYDGLYAFTGSGSNYLTQNTEWIWTSRTETNGVIPVLAPAQKANVFAAYGNHELFVAYVDSNGVTHRQVAHDVYMRWRNDDQSTGNITAMFFEQDTGQLIVGKDDGMVYIDRINDFDSGGWSSSGQIMNPIAFTLQTPQLDLQVPKAYKNFNECTVDATLPTGLVVTVTAIFDSLATVISLGTMTGTGSRTQYQLNIEDGDGYRSLNMGLKLTGSTVSQAVFHETHIRAVIEAEERQSYDSYKLDFGSASFKFVKQGWFVYAAPDPAGIEMAIYLDDNPIPSYIFTLPQTPIANTRTTMKVRFPALKFRIIRLVGTSDSPFQMYTKDTELETKNCDSQKGWQKMALST